jgi:hypothetical protein
VQTASQGIEHRHEKRFRKFPAAGVQSAEIRQGGCPVVGMPDPKLPDPDAKLAPRKSELFERLNLSLTELEYLRAFLESLSEPLPPAAKS